MAAISQNDIFKCIFLNENIWISNTISLKYVPGGLIDDMSAFFSDNGLVPSRRQAIIWTNADLNHRRIYAALGGDELSQSMVYVLKSASQHVIRRRIGDWFWTWIILLNFYLHFSSRFRFVLMGTLWNVPQLSRKSKRQYSSYKKTDYGSFMQNKNVWYLYRSTV